MTGRPDQIATFTPSLPPCPECGKRERPKITAEPFTRIPLITCQSCGFHIGGGNRRISLETLYELWAAASRAGYRARDAMRVKREKGTRWENP